MIKEYDKLVRDNILEVIKTAGKQAEYRIIKDDIEFKEYLLKKLDEEILEYKQDMNVDELADIFEILYALAHANGVSINEIEKTRESKKSKNGGFNKRIVLLKTIE